MVKSPKGIKTFNFGFPFLLPVYPPEVNAVVFIRLMQKAEIALNELRVGDIKGDTLFCLRINTHEARKVLILVLKRTHTLRRVEIDGDLEVLFVQPAEQRFVIGEKLRVPAVARPALRLKNLADFFIREKTVAAEISVFLAEALDNVNPVPVHIYCCNGNGNLLFNEFLHKVNIFLLAVVLISAPPVAEAVARNERNGAAELKKFP